MQCAWADKCSVSAANGPSLGFRVEGCTASGEGVGLRVYGASEQGCEEFRFRACGLTDVVYWLQGIQVERSGLKAVDLRMQEVRVYSSGCKGVTTWGVRGSGLGFPDQRCRASGVRGSGLGFRV